MRRCDKYILAQIIGPFFFFTIVLTGIIWLAQSLRVIDTIVNNGQSARVFLEFTLLLLPMVLVIVLPVALFAGVLYTFNRLCADSEIVVLFASGFSGMALLRAVCLISGIVMVGTYAISLYLMPTAQREMRSRITQIRSDIVSAFIREGTFLSPAPGVTVYLHRLGRPGEMFGVFVDDARNSDEVITYTAKRALLLRDTSGSRLVMFDGIVQNKATKDETNNLSTLRFSQLSYDLSQFTDPGSPHLRKPSEMYLPRLLSINETEAAPRKIGDFRAEAHEALSAPLYALSLPLVAVAFVVGISFRRGSLGGRIVLAVCVGLILRLSGLAAKNLISSAPVFWPLLYIPPLLGIGIALFILIHQGRRFPRVKMGAGKGR